MLLGLCGRLVQEDANYADRERTSSALSPDHITKCIRSACAACCTFLGEVFIQNRKNDHVVFVALAAFLVSFS